MTYWKEVAKKLPTREFRHPIHGDHAKMYRIIERLIELNSYGGGGPPACTEQPCDEEDHFVLVELPKARQNLIKDIAAAFGFKITGFEVIQN